MVLVAIRPKQPPVPQREKARRKKYANSRRCREAPSFVEVNQSKNLSQLPLISVFLPRTVDCPRTHRTPDSCGRTPRETRSPSETATTGVSPHAKLAALPPRSRSWRAIVWIGDAGQRGPRPVASSRSFRLLVVVAREEGGDDQVAVATRPGRGIHRRPDSFCAKQERRTSRRRFADLAPLVHRPVELSLDRGSREVTLLLRLPVKADDLRLRQPDQRIARWRRA